MIHINSLIYAQILLYLIIINILIPFIKQLNTQINIQPNIDIFEKYYSTNRYQSIIIDFLMNYIILNLANKLPNNIPTIYRRIITILFFDVLFTIYIMNTPLQTSNILLFKEWSLSVGWFAILWDILYINSVGIFTDQLTYRINTKSNNIHLFIASLILFILFHL